MVARPNGRGWIWEVRTRGMGASSLLRAEVKGEAVRGLLLDTEERW